MRDQEPIRTARRTAKRVARLGNDASCLFCGYAHLESLSKVSRRWLESNGVSQDRTERLLEHHHCTGEAHDRDLLITLCLNCHREVTEGLAREGVSMRPEKNVRKLTVFRLRASAVQFEFLARFFREWAALLENEVENE
jgi:hypothetical protein